MCIRDRCRRHYPQGRHHAVHRTLQGDAVYTCLLYTSINRQVNCETANMMKAADASARQIAAIQALIDSRGEDAFPGNLWETVRLRLEYPCLLYTSSLRCVTPSPTPLSTAITAPASASSPVSYTHLPNCSRSFLWKFNVCFHRSGRTARPAGTVSYTHLDVYKRQSASCSATISPRPLRCSARTTTTRSMRVR